MEPAKKKFLNLIGIAFINKERTEVIPDWDSLFFFVSE